jgi:ribosome-binding factor A
MLPYKRSERVGHLLRKEVSDIIMNRVKDPRLGFLTVTDVDVTRDLKLARVYISILKDEDRDLTMKILNSAGKFVRSELGRRLRMKVIPDIEFRVDATSRYGEKIERLLREIREGS